ncbi:MAG: hypothetical protein A2X12_04610 [Bacteroidetes bacterium GWE2_29_8]|nr:MAG: hypothetical protein A2X12_04610 [Bacteroidetes bacterium GWE2_29_8]
MPKDVVDRMVTHKLNCSFYNMQKIKYTGYWTFFCNPKYWAVDDFLLNIDNDFISQYRITSWQKDFFKTGQLGVIRVGLDSRNQQQLNNKKRLERGIYAIVEIIDSPFQQKNSESNFTINHQMSESGRYVVPIKYIRNYINKPVLFSDIENDFIIKSDFYLLKGHQAASMPLTENAFNRILLYGEEGL